MLSLSHQFGYHVHAAASLVCNHGPKMFTVPEVLATIKKHTGSEALKNGGEYRRSCKAVSSMHDHIFDVFLQGMVTHIGNHVKLHFLCTVYFRHISAKNGDGHKPSCKAVSSMHGRIFDVLLQRMETHIGDRVKPYFSCTTVFLTDFSKEW